MERLDRSVREGTRVELAAFLREASPDQVAHLDDEALAAAILAGESLAAEKGVTIDQGFDLFSMLYALFGPDFMEQEPMKEYFEAPGCTMNDKALILLKTWGTHDFQGGV